jgi:hypothetical protein
LREKESELPDAELVALAHKSDLIRVGLMLRRRLDNAEMDVESGAHRDGQNAE